MNYLVSGHLGGYYISNDSPSRIMQVCEQCGDCDIIIGAWEDEAEEYEVLLDFLCEDRIFNNLEETISEYFGFTYFEMNPIVDLLMDIKSDVEGAISLVDEFYKYGDISKDLADRLKVDIKTKEKEAYDFVRNYDYSNLNYQKVKKK